MVITTATITTANIHSQPHKNVYVVINNRSNVADPRNLNSNSNRKFVYLIDPFHKGTTFNDTPYVVVRRPRQEYSHISIDGKEKQINWTQRIIVRTSYSGAANQQDGTGLDDSWNICDDLEQTFNSETIKQSLRNVRMYKMNLELMDEDDPTIQDDHMVETEYGLSYETRIVVSS